MPTKRVSFTSHSPTTAIMKNVYLLTEVNNNAETGKKKYAVKFIHSEKTTKFCEIITLLVTATTQKDEDFAKFCGLFRIYEL